MPEQKNYRDKYRRLQGLALELGSQLPGPLAGFAQLRKQAFAEGGLPKKMKELIALGISVSTLCEGCVAYHVHDSVKAGATREEILETIGVALMMGGGPALVFACEAYEALNQFEPPRDVSGAA